MCSPGFGFGSISAGFRGRFALVNFKMDPNSVRAWGLGRLGFGLQLGRNSGSGSLGLGRLAGFQGSVGRLGWLGWLVRVGRLGCLGSGVGLVIGSGRQVIRSGRLGNC